MASSAGEAVVSADTGYFTKRSHRCIMGKQVYRTGGDLLVGVLP